MRIGTSWTGGALPGAMRRRHLTQACGCWRDGQVALRWCAAGRVEAGKQFRRVNGHLHLPKLRAALDAEIAGTVRTTVQDEQVVSA